MEGQRKGLLLLACFLLASFVGGVGGEVPDDVVYTDLHKTVQIGDSVVLTCQFRGTPLAVYWKKGDDPIRAPTLVSWNTGDPVTGLCESERLCQIMEMNEDHSLVIKEVSIAEQGRYICRVSNYRGILIHNLTDINVFSPPMEPYPIINECQMISPNDIKTTCTISTSQSVEISCSASGYFPYIDLYFLHGSISLHTKDTVEVENLDGTKNKTISAIAIASEISYVCFVSTIPGLQKQRTATVSVNLVRTSSTPIPAGITISIDKTDGSVAKVVVPVISIVILAVICISIILLRRMKQQSGQGRGQETKKPDDDDALANLPLLPSRIEFEGLTEKIKNYKPGSFSRLEKKEGRIWPEVTRLGVFGVTHAGKSSLVRSLNYSLTGEFIAVEVAQSHSIGGVTVIPKPFALTNHITIVDNRGLKDLDVSYIKYIMDQIRGQSKLLEGTVDFPILVVDARHPLKTLDKFLPDFVNAIRDEFGSHPAIVFTHRNIVEERMDTIKAQATGMGALDQKLYFIENFTQTPTEPSFERRLELLKMLKTMLECADENLIVRDDKKRRGNGSTNVVQIDVADPYSTLGKGFFGFLKKK